MKSNLKTTTTTANDVKINKQIAIMRCVHGKSIAMSVIQESAPNILAEDSQRIIHRFCIVMTSLN